VFEVYAHHRLAFRKVPNLHEQILPDRDYRSLELSARSERCNCFCHLRENPGMQRVLQAVGRLIRSGRSRGGIISGSPVPRGKVRNALPKLVEYRSERSGRGLGLLMVGVLPKSGDAAQSSCIEVCLSFLQMTAVRVATVIRGEVNRRWKSSSVISKARRLAEAS